MKEHEDCRGCDVNIKRTCFMSVHDIVELCPCLLCIVKITCKDTCDNFDDVAQKKIEENRKNGGPEW